MFNFRHNEKYKTVALYATVVIVVSALIILAILNFSDVFETVKKFFKILSPFTYGFVIAYLCTPVLNFYERRLFTFKKAKGDVHRLKRALSLILTVITAAAIIAVLAYAVIPQTVKSVNDFANHFNYYFEQLQGLADELTQKYSDLIFSKSYSSFTEMLLDHDITFNIKDILSSTVTLFTSSFDRILSAGKSFVGEVFNILMGIFIALYFLAGKEKICAQTKKLLASIQSRRTYLNTIRLARYTHKTFGGFIIGKLIDSAIIGLLSFVVMWIFKIPYYPLLAVIIGVTNIVPTFGPIVGGVIGSVIVLIASPHDTLIFIIIVFLIQQLDGNIIGPKILGDSIGISALWVIVAIVLCGGLFGFGGILIGVPTVAVIYSLIKQSAEKRLKDKDLPQSTAFYAEDPPSEKIDANHIFLYKEEDIPSVTAKDDIPILLNEKSPSLIKKIKNIISSNKSKGNKKQ